MGEPKNDNETVQDISFRVGYLLLVNGNMSQKRLALAMGLTPGQLNHKMVGRAKWSVAEVVALCDFFGVSLPYLIGRLPLESAGPITQETPANAGVVRDEDPRTSD